jgi:hypothetical protein
MSPTALGFLILFGIFGGGALFFCWLYSWMHDGRRSLIEDSAEAIGWAMDGTGGAPDYGVPDKAPEQTGTGYTRTERRTQ